MNIKALFKSWKTSSAGITALLSAVSMALPALTDGDPNTIPDWQGIMTLVLVGFGLVSSKDGDKSTEDVK